MANSYLTRLEELLWPAGFRRDVWMIVDGARDSRVFGSLLNSYLEYSCLYSGSIPPELERAAPYLVQLEQGGRDTRNLLERGWGNHWGVVLRCDSSLERLRRHLRKFLLVRDPGGKRLVFRYYDPRVLRAFLPTCTEREIAEFFGPVEAFYTEDLDDQNVWEFRREGSSLKHEKLALTSSSAGRAERA